MGRDQDRGPGRVLEAAEEAEAPALVVVAPALVAVAPVVGVPPVVHRLVVLSEEVLVVVAGTGRWWLWGRTLP